jgi:hypothetical protein
MPDTPDSSYDFAPLPEDPAPATPPKPAPKPPAKSAPKKTPAARVSEPSGEIPLAPAPAPSPKAPAADRPTTAPRPITRPDETPGTPCPHCGFLIRGKTSRNRCPECSGSLEPSAINLLQFAPTAWTRTLAFGTLLLLPAIAAYVAAIILTWSNHSPADKYAHLAAPAFALLGTLLVTIRDPHAIEKSPFALPARLAALAVLILWLPLTLKDPTPRAAHLMLYPILLATAAHAFCLGFHLRALAIRIPSDSLAAQALNLAWILSALCLFLLTLTLFDLARPEYLALFMCAFPLIAILGALLLWAAIFSLMMTLQLFSAASAADLIATRRATTAAKATTPKTPRP